MFSSHPLFRIFRVVLLFSYQVSLTSYQVFAVRSLVRQRDIYYHTVKSLSTTFFIFLLFLICDVHIQGITHQTDCKVFQQNAILPNHAWSHVRQKSAKKHSRNLYCANGERGIWTLAPLLTTYSLSRGAPSASWVFLQILSGQKTIRRNMNIHILYNELLIESDSYPS